MVVKRRNSMKLEFEKTLEEKLKDAELKLEYAQKRYSELYLLNMLYIDMREKEKNKEE